MARRRDATDVAIESWARTKRELLGLTAPRLDIDCIGPLRCTLAARRDLHHGSRTQKPDQHWPEFPFAAGSDAWIINEAFRRLPDPLADVIVAHYVVLTPRDRTVRADLMGVARRAYWERLGRAKAFLEGALATSRNID